MSRSTHRESEHAVFRTGINGKGEITKATGTIMSKSAGHQESSSVTKDFLNGDVQECLSLDSETDAPPIENKDRPWWGYFPEDGDRKELCEDARQNRKNNK